MREAVGVPVLVPVPEAWPWARRWAQPHNAGRSPTLVREARHVRALWRLHDLAHIRARAKQPPSSHSTTAFKGPPVGRRGDVPGKAKPGVGWAQGGHPRRPFPVRKQHAVARGAQGRAGRHDAAGWGAPVNELQHGARLCVAPRQVVGVAVRLARGHALVAARCGGRGSTSPHTSKRLRKERLRSSNR